MVRRVLGILTVLMINGWLLAACQGNETRNPGTTGKGVKIVMKTYYMGRFAVDVPVELKQAVQAHTIRYAKLEEFLWPLTVTRENARQNAWNQRLTETSKLSPPRGKREVVIKTLNTSERDKWLKGLMYYGNYVSSKEANWGVLIDAGVVGLWGDISGLLEYEDHMKTDLLEIMNAYRVRPPENPMGFAGNWYHLKYGSINLPYLEQEKTYARFEGHPLDLKLEVEMKETHEVEKLGVAERLAASIATRFAPGVDVDKIRSRSRTAAGLKGEELVMRMSASGEDTQIQFAWEYRGEVDSGERPEIQITMETPDGNLNEKLKIWDAILDSFKPTYASGK